MSDGEKMFQDGYQDGINGAPRHENKDTDRMYQCGYRKGKAERVYAAKVDADEFQRECFNGSNR